jgi:hypothetical protein
MYQLTVSKPDKDLFISIAQPFDECFKDAVRLMKLFKQPKPIKPEEGEVEVSCGEYILKFKQRYGSKD